MLPAPNPEHLLSLHLERLMRDSPPAAQPPPETARAVADAVILCLRDQGLTLPLPDGYLRLMIYRALRAVGPETTARAWAAAHLTESTAQLARSPDRTLRPVFDPLIWPGPVPLIVWQLFESHLVRPLRTITLRGRLVWRLDFRRLVPTDAGWMELTLFPGLHAILERLADAFDDTQGRGIIGLAGLYASGFAPTPRRRRRGRPAPRGIAPLDAPAVRDYILRVLHTLSATRHWTTLPEVIYLDLTPARKTHPSLP
ncbi:MAG: hypothetical protein IKO01_07165 [Kiritimatiellae bacterium]|nr:hypothetical protein [Kiritimatiellia bacterium]